MNEFQSVHGFHIRLSDIFDAFMTVETKNPTILKIRIMVLRAEDSRLRNELERLTTSVSQFRSKDYVEHSFGEHVLGTLRRLEKERVVLLSQISTVGVHLDFQEKLLRESRSRYSRKGKNTKRRLGKSP